MFRRNSGFKPTMSNSVEAPTPNPRGFTFSEWFVSNPELFDGDKKMSAEEKKLYLLISKLCSWFCIDITFFPCSFWQSLVKFQQDGHYFNMSRSDPMLFHLRDLSNTSTSNYYYCYGSKDAGQVAHFLSVVNVAEDTNFLTGNLNASTVRKQKRLTGQLLVHDYQRFYMAAKQVFGGEDLYANMRDNCFDFTTKFLMNSMY